MYLQRVYDILTHASDSLKRHLTALQERVRRSSKESPRQGIREDPVLMVPTDEITFEEIYFE